MSEVSCDENMTSAKNGSVVEIGQELFQRFRLIERLMDLLIQKAVVSEHWPEAYVRADQVLETLPLATGSYGLAKRRLRNACGYASAGQFGPAAFELRVLRGKLQSD